MTEQAAKRDWKREYEQLEAENAGLREELAIQAKDSLRLIETVKYLRGIAERGSGDLCPEDVTIKQFVLGFVKNLEQHIKEQAKQLAEGRELRRSQAKVNGDLSEQLAAAQKDAAAKQANIDSLMLEYCPNEMTHEQIAEWKRNQRPDEGEQS